MRNLLAILTTGTVLAAAPAIAGGDAEQGAGLFSLHCAACHGAGAAGDGPMTAILSIDPPDLRGIGAREGFGLDDLVRRVDGRDMILAHGGPMPLFGQLLEGESAVVDGADGTPVFTTQEVLDIVTWIAALD